MADCSNEFSKYHETIKLDETKQRSLRQSRDAIRNRIRTYFADTLDANVPSFRCQGSYAMSTIVNPISGEYDIDDGVYLNNLESDKAKWPTASTVHNWLYSAVDGQTNEKPTDKNKCVRVTYTGQYHVDLPIYGMHGGRSYLAVQDNGWTASDPKALTDWFLAAVQDKGEQLRRIVRYLKAWADYKSQSGSLPSSLVLTVLTEESFSESSRDDMAFADTVNNVRLRLAASSTIYNPIDAGERLSDSVSENQLRNLREGLAALASAAATALADVSIESACVVWQHELGARFPSGAATKSSGSHVVFSGGIRPWAQ